MNPQQNGLMRWRAAKEAERQAQLAFLEHCRKDAVHEERDGQTFRVVRLPDAYDFNRREPQSVKVQLRQPRRRLPS